MGYVFVSNEARLLYINAFNDSFIWKVFFLLYMFYNVHHNAIRVRLLFLWAFRDLFASISNVRLDYKMLCSSAKVKENDKEHVVPLYIRWP